MNTTALLPPHANLGHLRRLAALRWVAVAAELGVIFAAQPLFDITLPLTPMLFIVALLAAFNVVTLLRLRDATPVKDLELFAQLGVDLTALTVLLFFSGGAANPFVSLYLPPIAIAAAVLPASYAWILAGVSVMAYSTLVLWHVPLAMQDLERAAHLHLSGMWLIFVASALLITWFVARMTEAVQSRDRQLATAREAALRNERVVALGSLAAGAAHELGTPLATMAVVVGELQREPQASVAMKEEFTLLAEQIAHCKRIITGLAEQAGQTRAEGGRAIAIDSWLEAVIARWQQLRPHAPAKIALQGATPAPRIVGEATLEQALLNLFNNAADAAPEEVEIDASWSASDLHLEVRDRGPGIDAQVLLKAGRDFITTRQDGAGIGLFLAHAVVERLGGRVTLSNRAEGGAITRVDLPLRALLTDAP